MLEIASNKDSIILDSFAGSGTTAHAVLNMNKADGGHRKFILVEVMDYADSITAERVKRVIRGYGEGKNAVEGTGGNFSFYDLGEPLLVGDCLNEAVAPEKLRAAARDGAGLCVPLHHYGKSRWNGDLCRPLLHQRGQAGKNGRYIQEDSTRY